MDFFQNTNLASASRIPVYFSLPILRMAEAPSYDVKDLFLYFPVESILALLLTLMDCTNVKRSVLMLTLRRSSLMSLAARKRRRKPTLTICVASTMLPTTVMKSNAFHGSLKYGCGRTEKWDWNDLVNKPVAISHYRVTRLLVNNLPLTLF